MAEKGVESEMMDEDPMDLGVPEDEKTEVVGGIGGIGVGLPIGIIGRSKEDVEDGECSSLSDSNESGMGK